MFAISFPTKGLNLTVEELRSSTEATSSFATLIAKLGLPSNTFYYRKLRKAVQDHSISTEHFRTTKHRSLEALDQQRVDYSKKIREKEKLRRKDPKSVAHYILVDSRGSDKKSKLDNDLDKQFIQETISIGCCYCGETEIRMTLDRVDNAKGHIKSNVKPACIRCNLIRGSMPYPAWKLVAPSIRDARERAFQRLVS